MRLKYLISIIVSKFLNSSFCDRISLKKSLKRILKLEDPSNRVLLIKTNGEVIENPKLKNITFRFLGKNNTIKIYEPFYINYLFCSFKGSNNNIIINKKSKILKKMNIIFESNNTLEIGKNFSLQSLFISFRNAINTSIKIGENCMFSYNIVMRTGDSHTIYDKETKEVLNFPKNIEIGNHVWLTANVKLLKGGKIPDNCIVGTNSLVTKAFEEENCIIAGSPAKVVKTGVNWHKCGPHQWDSYKDFV